LPVGVVSLHERHHTGDERDDQEQRRAHQEPAQATVRTRLRSNLVRLVGTLAIREPEAGVEKRALGCVQGFGFASGPFACGLEARPPVEV
jgi:hypothetical protein